MKRNREGRKEEQMTFSINIRPNILHLPTHNSHVSQMYVNGSALDDYTFQRISEYVQHEDVFVPTQTLEDALLYHCHLRLGPTVPLGEKRAKIEGLAHEAGLSDKMHTR